MQLLIQIHIKDYTTQTEINHGEHTEEGEAYAYLHEK